MKATSPTPVFGLYLQVQTRAIVVWSVWLLTCLVPASAPVSVAMAVSLVGVLLDGALPVGMLCVGLLLVAVLVLMFLWRIAE